MNKTKQLHEMSQQERDKLPQCPTCLRDREEVEVAELYNDPVRMAPMYDVLDEIEERVSMAEAEIAKIALSIDAAVDNVKSKRNDPRVLKVIRYAKAQRAVQKAEKDLQQFIADIREDRG